MLDPALCDTEALLRLRSMLEEHSADRSMTHWFVIKDVISDWFMTPALVILPLAAIVGLPWLIPRLRRKRLLMGLGSILLVIYFTATSPLTIALANKGLVAFLPEDAGETVDAIVVLGRGDEFRPSRVEVAAQLWKAHRAPLIFASGSGDASQLVELFKAQGIPNQALAYEECSRTTEENARLTATVLKPQGVKRILLVTDPPHMLRSLVTFRHFGFTVIPRTSPLPPDLAPRRKTQMVFYEYLGLVSYGLQGRFFLPSLPEAINLQQGEENFLHRRAQRRFTPSPNFFISSLNFTS
jgi:uncharacterized SAM-binding protein YcdF (DUF218 family)